MARNYCRICGRRIAPGLTVCGPECAGIDALPDEAFDEAAELASNWRAKKPASREPHRAYNRRHEKSEVRKRIDTAFMKNRRYYEQNGDLP